MIRCKNCEAGQHQTADEVRECYSVPRVRVPSSYAVEPELVEWIRKQGGSFFGSLAEFYDRRGYLTEKQIAAAMRTRESQAKPEAPEGVHVLDGTIYKVQRAVHGSGRKYVKMFNVNAERFVKTQKPGILKALSEDTVMGAEEAAAFGHLYGMCVYCSRTLTDERSIFVGYGAICAEKWGLPWGEVAPIDR